MGFVSLRNPLKSKLESHKSSEILTALILSIKYIAGKGKNLYSPQFSQSTEVHHTSPSDRPWCSLPEWITGDSLEKTNIITHCGDLWGKMKNFMLLHPHFPLSSCREIIYYGTRPLVRNREAVATTNCPAFGFNKARSAPNPLPLLLFSQFPLNIP